MPKLPRPPRRRYDLRPDERHDDISAANANATIVGRRRYGLLFDQTIIASGWVTNPGYPLRRQGLGDIVQTSLSSKRSDYAAPPHGLGALSGSSQVMRHNPVLGIMGQVLPFGCGRLAFSGLPDHRFELDTVSGWRRGRRLPRGEGYEGPLGI